jgi:CheY-like chemotaxis protein
MKIAILEDYQRLGRILETSLRLSGHEVYACQTIIDFLALVTSSDRVDLIVIDYLLLAERSEAKISGADVIRHVRKIMPDLPAILISAAPLATLQKATAGLSGVKLLSKPFKTAALLEMVRTIQLELERKRC